MACYYYIMFTMCIPAIQTMDTRSCKDEEFLDTKTGACIPCTTRCPGDQVIRRTCGLYRDVECGPLVELSAFFKQLSEKEDAKAIEHARIMTSSVGPEMHVASLDGSVHEANTLLHALLLVLLFLTALIIVLTTVALVMYRKRNSQSRKDPDPESEVSSLDGQQVLEVLDVTQPGSLVLLTPETALLNPYK